MDWMKDGMRIAALQVYQEEMTFKAPAIMAENGFNVDQLCHLMGDSVGGIFSKAVHGEKLEQYMAETRKYGTRVIMYYNAHCVTKEHIQKDPSHAQRRADGSPAPAYGSLVLTCVNTPWRDMFMERLAECLPYGVDGIFLDGPIFGGTCHCDHCQQLFTGQYGHSIEEGSFREITDFKTASIARFVKDAKETILAIRPEVPLYCNSTGLGPNVTGCDLDAVGPYVDLIGTEGGFMFYGDPADTSLWKGASSANYLESKAGDKPYVIFAAGNHCAWAQSMHTAPETRLLFASAIAHGAQVWYGLHGSVKLLDTPGGQAACQMNRFLERNVHLLQNTKRAKKTAILWAKESLNAFSEDVDQSDFTQAVKLAQNVDRGSFLHEFRGLYDLLVRQHVQVSIIDEANVRSGELDGFTHLYIPNAFCMSDDVAQLIRSFVENGGHLVATMATSFFDEAGHPRQNPALGDLFGIDQPGQFYFYGPGCSYYRLGEALRQTTGLPEVIAGNQRTVRNSYDNSVSILAESFIPLAGGYAPMPTEAFPVVLQKKAGKGCCTYIAGSIGETIARFGVMDQKVVATALFLEDLDSDIIIENAYESMDIELRLQSENNRKLVHLVNYTGPMQRPIPAIIPCLGMKIRVRCQSPVKTVYAAWTEQELPFTESGGFVEFTLPRLGEYELIAIDC